ncbi:RING-type domain-containing protein [Psidium guajava]|nr:RING-type domain-containing protein [Psidium guajava]
MEEQGSTMSKNHEQAETDSSPSSSSSSRPCPICLSPTPHLQESYLDRCFHKFCYKCIVQWTKVVASKHSEAPSSLLCPFCKTENFSIIHGYDGSSFERHYVSQIFSDSVFFTEAHRYRLRCYYVEPGILGDAFDVKRFWKIQKYPQSNPWLYSWLKREIQALLQEEDVDVVVHHMLGTIESSLRSDDQRKLKAPEQRQMELKMLLRDAARPFLTGRTDRFVDETELFLASGLNLGAYDDIYMRRLGWKSPGIDSLEEPTDNSAVALRSSLFDFDDEDPDGAE